MNKNQSYYIEAWKKHVANQRLLSAIPDFELVFGKNNLLRHDYHKAIDYYKSKLSMMKAHAEDPNLKNSYLTFLNKLLEEERQGFTMALILYKIKVFILSQEPQHLQESITTFETLLYKDPTLVAIVPHEILLFLRTAKIKRRTLSNVIYVTKQHRFSCYACNTVVSGEQCSILKCLCSTKVYHENCTLTAGKRCYICNSVHTYINSSRKNKQENDDQINRSTRSGKHVEATDYKAKKDSFKSKYGEEKTINGFPSNKECCIINNATLWDDGIC
tara:strand:+ start:165 stop:986 length:822 start_codon:yes stop_codon:yes gene_type:complete